MTPPAEKMSAIIEMHGVAFELRGYPSGDGAITPDDFQKYVDKLRRMVIGLSQADAEMLRDELLIVDAAGNGVRLDQLAEHHPLSMSASAAEKGAREAAQIRIRAFDPVLNPIPPRR